MSEFEEYIGFKQSLEAFRTQLEHFQDGTARCEETISKLHLLALSLPSLALREIVRQHDPAQLSDLKALAEEAVTAITQWQEDRSGNQPKPNIRPLINVVEFCEKQLDIARSAEGDRRNAR